jgi:hypothetical protein
MQGLVRLPAGLQLLVLGEVQLEAMFGKQSLQQLRAFADGKQPGVQELFAFEL